MRGCASAAVLAAVLVAGGTAAAHAQLAVSANDAKVRLVNGKTEVVQSPPPDTVSIIDCALVSAEGAGRTRGAQQRRRAAHPTLRSRRRRTSSSSPARCSSIPTDPTKTIPDDKLTVIDIAPLKPGILKRLGLSKGGAPAPKVIATLQAGKGAAGVAINKAGTLALVANRSEGTVSAFTISGTTVTAAGKVTVGGEKSGPSAVAFTPDGKTALVTLDGDHKIVVLAVDGAKVEVTKRVISAGLRPYGLDIAAKGEVAVVANIGLGGGDADTISIIDLKLEPPRVVNTYTVGQTPEGIKMSPDGKFVAVTVMNGTNKPSDSPFFNVERHPADLGAQRHAAHQVRRAADREVVPGHRLVEQQPYAAGAVHGGGRDHGRALSPG